MDIVQHCLYLVEVIDQNIVKKETEKENITSLGLDIVGEKVKISQVQAEIDELKMQRAYYSDFYRDEMMKRCVSGFCSNCSTCKF